MLKFLAGVVVSVVLSVSSVLGLIHGVSPVKESVATLRQATWLVKGEFGTCSGVLIAPKRLLTAAHCEQPVMTVGGEEARVLARNAATDLLLLEVNVRGVYFPVYLANLPEDVAVKVVGFPLNRGVQYLTDGTTQGDVPGYEFYTAISAPVMFGNSGGPVFAKVNGVWMVVGIVSAVASGTMGGMFPFVVPHMGLMVNGKAIGSFLKDVDGSVAG